MSKLKRINLRNWRQDVETAVARTRSAGSSMQLKTPVAESGPSHFNKSHPFQFSIQLQLEGLALYRRLCYKRNNLNSPISTLEWTTTWHVFDTSASYAELAKRILSSWHAISIFLFAGPHFSVDSSFGQYFAARSVAPSSLLRSIFFFFLSEKIIGYG